VIVGDGRAREDAEKEIAKLGLQESFVFVGRHPVNTMPWFFKQADAMLVSLKDEFIFSLTIPSKVQAYMATGKPILTMLNGEGSKVVEEAGCGLTAASEDYKTLAENVKKMYEMGVQRYPNQIIFLINLIQTEFQAHNYDKAIELSEQTIAKIEDGSIPSTNEQGEKQEAIKWPYYFKAVSLFNQQKYEEAYAAFEAASAVEDNFDNLSGAANCAAQLGQRKGGSNKAEGNKWYDKAIELYGRCETEYPEQSDVWGIQLYVCWNNKASLNNSQEMLKKAKAYEKYKK
jgi:tetratricopeptide (TPR) repeat protein